MASQNSVMNNFEVIATRTGHKMHMTSSCRTLSRSYGLRTITVKSAFSQGLTPCSICCSFGNYSYLPSINFQRLNHLEHYPQLLLDQSSFRPEVENGSQSTESSFTVNDNQVIRNDYSINNDSRNIENRNLLSVSHNSRSSCLNNNQNVGEKEKENDNDLFNSILSNINAKEEKEDLKEIQEKSKANKKELVISREVDESVIKEKIPQKHQAFKEIDYCIIKENKQKEFQIANEVNDILINKNSIKKDFTISNKINNSIINVSKKDLQISNEINDSIINEIKNEKMISINESVQTDSEIDDNDNKSLSNSQSINQSNYSLSITSSKVTKIKDIDYFKDIDSLNKDDLIQMPKKNERIFIRNIMKPKRVNAQCRLGFELMTFGNDNKIDEMESITNKYSINEITIIVICCDKKKNQIYAKYKTEKEKEWNYGKVKAISNYDNDTMIRPFIQYNEKDYFEPSITAFKTN